MSEQNCKDCNQWVLTPECDGRATLESEQCEYFRLSQTAEVQKIIDDLERQNREYDDKEAYQDDFKRNVIIISALRAQQEQSNPQPLTWEEFEQMAKKPVWVENILYPKYSRWQITSFFQTTREGTRRAWTVYAGDYRTEYLYKRDLGVKFNLYAHEPKGEHHG